MAKKKVREEETIETPKMELMPDTESAGDDAASGAEAVETGTVLEEVQAFLAQRAELARKLALEIEATEKKLAELKQSAALLTPAPGGGATKEKKAKKASKPKAVARREEPVSEPAEAEPTV